MEIIAVREMRNSGDNRQRTCTPANSVLLPSVLARSTLNRLLQHCSTENSTKIIGSHTTPKRETTTARSLQLVRSLWWLSYNHIHTFSLKFCFATRNKKKQSTRPNKRELSLRETEFLLHVRFKRIGLVLNLSVRRLLVTKFE